MGRQKYMIALSYPLSKQCYLEDTNSVWSIDLEYFANQGKFYGISWLDYHILVYINFPEESVEPDVCLTSLSAILSDNLNLLFQKIVDDQNLSII